MPIISREAINMENNPKQNFSLLKKSSACDNVLLEYHLALEFHERDLIRNIYPVFVGDQETDAVSNALIYLDYFKSGCHPVFTTTVAVVAVELTMQEHLDRYINTGLMMFYFFCFRVRFRMRSR